MHLLLKPSNFLCLPHIKFWNVWLDVQKGSPIYNVYVPDMEHVPFDPDETYRGNANWVRPTGASHGKDAMCFVIHIGFHLQRRPLGQMKVVYQNNVGEALHIFQPFGVFWKYLDCSINAFSARRLYRCSFGFSERGVDDADGLVSYFVHFFSIGHGSSDRCAARDQAGGKILPGLRMLFGSQARLMRFCISTASGPMAISR